MSKGENIVDLNNELPKHILVTNDFPPKIGGIQSYLFDLWKNIDPHSFVIITTFQQGCETFDSELDFKVIRLKKKFLAPTRGLEKVILKVVEDIDAQIVIFDPVFPLGLIAKRIKKRGIDYGIIIHGAELTVPANIPLVNTKIAKVISNSQIVIEAGNYPWKVTQELLVKKGVKKEPYYVNVFPGIDGSRFLPIAGKIRDEARKQFGLESSQKVVLSVSRLVRRKGMDTLILAMSELSFMFPDIVCVIAGKGRDRSRLEKLIRKHDAPVNLLGEISQERLPDLYGCSDVFVMACRDRWFGLEREGFGIVFLEAQACGVPQIAGLSGGAGDAVVQDSTGYLVDSKNNPSSIVNSVYKLLSEESLYNKMSEVSAERAHKYYDYKYLANQLLDGLKAYKINQPDKLS